METRVIVADSARARIFASHSALRHLEEVEGFAHPEAHKSNRDLASDSAGKSVDQHGALESATSPKAHEAENFARMLAQHLKDLHNQQHYEQLVLIAPPQFLGLLNKQLPKPLDKLVTKTVDKDLTTHSIEDIIGYIET
jgi:protein required for attachment to host cells